MSKKKTAKKKTAPKTTRLEAVPHKDSPAQRAHALTFQLQTEIIRHQELFEMASGIAGLLESMSTDDVDRRTVADVMAMAPGFKQVMMDASGDLGELTTLVDALEKLAAGGAR
ncbi:MAG TPA: hypothetical protein VI485_28765 [Vicinamibacterales bacterium]|nr:hypothetical protein [Vicinamibacterales bacterium]